LSQKRISNQSLLLDGEIETPERVLLMQSCFSQLILFDSLLQGKSSQEGGTE
jgi:hypothetical protein